MRAKRSIQPFLFKSGSLRPMTQETAPSTHPIKQPYQGEAKLETKNTKRTKVLCTVKRGSRMGVKKRTRV